VTGRDEIPLPLGVMLEIPSTYFIVDLLAQEVDFFALGSNDLVQYTLARDRNNMPDGSPFDSAQPAVRRGLEMLRRKTADHKKSVICCGEMASHPFFVLLLLALGYRHLSTNPAMLPMVRYIARTVDGKSLRRFYQQLSERNTLPEIEDFFLHRLGDCFPEPFVKTLLHIYRAEMG
jgi:phosphotransferase system enzyme I (PtsP)